MGIEESFIIVVDGILGVFGPPTGLRLARVLRSLLTALKFSLSFRKSGSSELISVPR